MTKETINLPRLISLIANGAGVDPVTARRFLHELFAQIEECLVAGERVDVKGVGEFVRGDNPADPVLFRPDARLAEIANEPFSIFTAVEVNDGAEAEIASVDIPTAGETTDEDISETAHYQEHAEDNGAGEEKVDTLENIPEETREEEPQSEKAPEPIGDEIAQEAVPDSYGQVDDTENEEKQPQPVRGYIEKSDPSQWEQFDDENYSEAPVEPVDRHGSGNQMMWLFLGILIGIILGLVGGYFAGKTMAAYEFDEEEMIPFADPDTAYVDETSQTALIDSVTPNEHVAAETSSVAEDEALEVTPAAPPSDGQSAAKEAAPVYDTVSANRYLTIMAKEHYGVKNYWVFIYEANPGLGNPDRVKAGTRVVIPSKDSFMEASREATDAKAAKLMQQIMARYK